MREPVKLEVENFRVVGSAEVTFEEGINILYGLNASGKSTIIYALLSMMGIHPTDESLMRKLKLDAESRVKVSGGSGYVEYSRGEYSCAVDGRVSRGMVVDEILTCIREFWENLGVRKVGYMADDTITVYEVAGGETSLRVGNSSFNESVQLKLELWNQGGWESITQLPQVLTGTLRHIRSLTGVEYIHTGYALKHDRWIRVELLSYGERKAAAIMLLSKYLDMLVVEGYEAGLHLDLAIRILNKLKALKRTTVVETHMGVLLPEGLEKGWNIYYVDEGKAIKLTRENALEANLFKREVKQYVRARWA